MVEEPNSQQHESVDGEPFEEVDALPGGIEPEPIEELDGIPVLLEAQSIEPRRPAPLPVPVQAAAVAVTGFFAGLLTIVLFQRRRARRAGRPLSRRAERRRGDSRGNVVASRSFLVDVHLLGGRD
jgi:hypothetical protein